MNIEIKPVAYQVALEFFLEIKAFNEHVTMTTKGDWFGAYEVGHESLLGICSTQQIGRWLRIKTLCVRKEQRRHGVANALVRKLSEGRQCTAFAFNSSLSVFISCGFTQEKTQKNGVHFMRKIQ